MLAPMEGVIDHTMRAMLTRDNDYERCVTEFLRVTDRLLPERVFFAICPELKQGGTTPSETPCTFKFWVAIRKLSRLMRREQPNSVHWALILTLVVLQKRSIDHAAARAYCEHLSW